MKKYFIILSCLILFGCTENNILETVTAPSKTIHNQKCENVPAVRVFQVLDTFALATTCEYGKYTGDLYCWGHTVYVPKDKGKIYYDDQIIKPEEDKCIVYSGTYKYESEDERVRTVPKIKFVKDEIENPEYTKWVKENKKKEQK